MPFALISKSEGCRLSAAAKQGMLKLEFIGLVDVTTIKALAKTGIEKISNEGFHKVLLDDTAKHEFTNEANEWIRDFLLTNRHKFDFKISRVAIVTPDSNKMNLYANFMKTAFQVIFPGVQIASFEFEESAVEWMT